MLNSIRLQIPIALPCVETPSEETACGGLSTLAIRPECFEMQNRHTLTWIGTPTAPAPAASTPCPSVGMPDSRNRAEGRLTYHQNRRKSEPCDRADEISTTGPATTVSDGALAGPRAGRVVRVTSRGMFRSWPPAPRARTPPGSMDVGPGSTRTASRPRLALPPPRPNGDVRAGFT